jgi:hypothetical protein
MSATAGCILHPTPKEYTCCMAYGRRQSAYSEQPCVNRGCGAPDRVERVDQVEKYGIPADKQPIGQSAYHCLHCSWVWFGTWSEEWFNVGIKGRWDGSNLLHIENPDVAHREPKAKKKATPFSGLKGREYKERSK